ncbi:Thoeris anti-defense Tad2 family protein [Halobacillus salinus]|uniref:Thoeris anti-defense 2-like domain-containing protein n=1 Tax=Halobacillus salinus TaxID=192814 RepID=A0A4Z0GY56_9BACI|nr:hypothetical protein [Halobacillus salinus]TGB02276.1 hypothetical protein E4663_13105 [Halobacillus salinus]
MNFLFAARLLDEGHALSRKSWNNQGYIFKDDRGRMQFFDHNEPHVYQPNVEDTLADDWVETAKDSWTFVSVAHEAELVKDKLFVSYQICSKEDGVVKNNHQIDEVELSTWARCVEFDLDQTATHLNEQDIAQVRSAVSA